MRAALVQDPDAPRVLYHLAQAIRALVEWESLVEAREHLSRYMELGALLGSTDDLRRFLAPQCG
jgi:hypothetical protein